MNTSLPLSLEGRSKDNWYERPERRDGYGNRSTMVRGKRTTSNAARHLTLGHASNKLQSPRPDHVHWDEITVGSFTKPFQRYNNKQHEQWQTGSSVTAFFHLLDEIGSPALFVATTERACFLP